MNGFNQEKPYKTVAKYGESEFVEKKSRFLSFVHPIENEADALDIIEKARKKYYDATHVVFGYKIKENNICRFSDDGEPQGTAGIPVLDVIVKNELENVLIIVVRYFGGTLLGAGGLVRAYSKSAVLGVENAGICSMTPCTLFEISCPYNLLQSVQFLLDSLNCVKIDIIYGSDILLKYYIDENDFEKLCEKITDKTNGQLVVRNIGNEFHRLKISI